MSSAESHILRIKKWEVLKVMSYPKLMFQPNNLMSFLYSIRNRIKIMMFLMYTISFLTLKVCFPQFSLSMAWEVVKY